MARVDDLANELPGALQGPLAAVVREVSRWKKRNRHFEVVPAMNDRLAPADESTHPADGTSPSHIELVGSSNGCASFTVHVGNRTLKCYECLTPARARLVHHLSRALRSQQVGIPECFGVRGKAVVAEWVDGRSMDTVGQAEKIELMAAYQARLHSVALPPSLQRHASMPHIRWLLDRVRRFRCGFVDETCLSRLQDRLIRSRPKAAPWGILHSDLITTNLVLTTHGVVSVDNEFLCVGYGQEWDILNTLKVSFPNRKRLQDLYLATYSKYRNLHTLKSHCEYWEACYEIKLAGKRLNEGRFEEGLRYLRSAADKV